MRKKSGWAVLLMIVMLVLISAIPVSAASQAQAAKQAYMKFLKQKTMKLSRKVSVKGSKIQFAIAYIDGDNIPDLMIKTNNKDIKYKWYTFKKGKVKSGSEAYYSDFSALKGYYKKKNMIYRVWASDADYEEYENIAGKNLCFKNVPNENYQWNDNVISKAKWKSKFKARVGNTKLRSFKFYKNTAANRNKYLG